MSDGVYVEPLGHRPPSERQPQGGAGKITSDSTYIAMGACGPSPQGEPTPPDQLDKEGERDEVYTVPNIHGSPPPIPCNGSKGPGYVNLPSPDVDGASLDDEQPLDDYQNVQTAVSPYRNISADASPQQPFSQVRRQLSSPASDPTAKKALKPPMPGNHGQRTPPKTSPKPAISPAHAFRSQSPALPSDTDSRPQSPKNGSGAALAAVLTAGNARNPSAKKKKKPAGASSSVHSPRPQPGTATDEESSDNESYENLPGTEQKRDYQNVPNKKTNPKHANRQQNNSSTSSSESASTRQRPPGARNRYQQKQQFPGALNDEFKKRMNRPKNLSTRKLEMTTVAKPYTIDESSGHVPVLPASTSLNSSDDEPRALSRNRSRDKNESTDKTKHEGSSVYSSSSPKPPLSVLVSLELSIPLTELETDGQILGHKLRLSKSDTALSQMGAAHPAMPRRSSSVHNVGHRNTLRHNLKSKVPDTEVLEPHSLDPKKNPSVGSPPPPISRKFWESSSTVSSVGGTVQKPDSGVILNVPHDAVDKDAKIDVLTAVCTDMDRVRRILNLPKDECVSSPLAEYWAGHEFRFKKPVSITLPTFLPPDPDLQLVRVYRVAHRCDGQLAITRLRPREESIHAVHLSDEQTDSDPHVPTTSRKGPKGQATDYADNLPWETDGFFWLSSDDQVIIKTNHFCGYVCTYCNLQQGPPVLKAIVCGSHTREEEGQHSSQITLYIWDKRLDIKDFQQVL